MTSVPLSRLLAASFASSLASTRFGLADVIAEAILSDPDHDLVADTGQSGLGSRFGGTDKLAREPAESTSRAGGELA
jgi:hypothetical protein